MSIKSHHVNLSISELYKLNEKIENVSNNRKFVWSAISSQGHVEPGFNVLNFDIKKQINHSKAHEIAEQTLERIRSQEFQDRPSRKNCKFVYSDIFAAKEYGDDVYQVEVTGKVFYTNLEIYTKIFELCKYYEQISSASEMMRTEKLIENTARNYWTGIDSNDKVRGGSATNVECLVDGSVTVIKKIDGNVIQNMKNPLLRRNH